jgi:ankyrin repeat protein
VTEIQKIINSGANVNAQSILGFTPLHVAVIDNRPEIVQLLLEHGANINAVTNKEKQSPLHLAIIANNLNMLQILIEKGADITLEMNDGTTSAQLALKKGNMSIILAIKGGG